jgi:uncharacterized membrane protein YfcA
VTIAVLLAAALAAYTLKGGFGFGPALILVPAVAAVSGPYEALAVTALVDAAVGVAMLARLGLRRAERRDAAILGAGVAVGAAAGGAVAGALPERLLLAAIGVSVLALAARMALAAPREARPRAGHATAGAICGGLSGGLVGISGPFVVAAASGLPKSPMRRVLVAVFLAESLARGAVYAATGILDEEAVRLSLALLPAVVAGLGIGAFLHDRVDEQRFRRLVAAVLAAVAVRALAAAA